MYKLVQWPEVQELMDEDWFLEEAILNFEAADSSYFIPVNRFYSLGVLIDEHEKLVSKVYGKYITTFMEKFKENGGNSIILWKEEMLANIPKAEFIELIKKNSDFCDLWGKLD